MLKEKLLEDLKVSMRDKKVIKKNTVQMIRAASANQEVNTVKIAIQAVAPVGVIAIRKVSNYKEAERNPQSGKNRFI